MTETVTIRTLDHGPVTVPEPVWCTGNHRHHHGGWRVDIEHTSAETGLAVPTPRGPVVLMRAMVEQRPFTEGPPGTGVFVNLGLEDDWYPSNPADLDAMAAALVEHAARLRRLARQLAALAAGEEECR